MIFPDELVSFLESGISITLASCSSSLIPSVARARGCRVIGHPTRPRLRILLPATESTLLLDDVRATHAVSVTFSNIRSHKTLQFKGRNATVDLITEEDAKTIAAYEISFGDSIIDLGFPRTFTRGFFAIDANDFMAVEFTPEDQFQQTPGPNAGSRVTAA